MDNRVSVNLSFGNRIYDNFMEICVKLELVSFSSNRSLVGSHNGVEFVTRNFLNIISKIHILLIIPFLGFLMVILISGENVS